ncbi:hypothetical protein [Bradyrhizobium sp. NBAIM01]|uniref:hypothetical protein n=1 Tax=Bradyrhizobium sp. NBAIM01 TaxID=2793818 RepID=UPI00320B3D8A
MRRTATLESSGDRENPKIRNTGGVAIDGFIGPAHVSILIGKQPCAPLAEHLDKPIVIAGLGRLDVMQANWFWCGRLTKTPTRWRTNTAVW